MNFDFEISKVDCNNLLLSFSRTIVMIACMGVSPVFNDSTDVSAPNFISSPITL